MSSPSGVGSASSINQQLQLMNIAEGVSETAMEETKQADKAARMDAAEAMRGVNIPGAMSEEGEVLLTSFNGPEVKTPDSHDLAKLEGFLNGEEYQLAQDSARERGFQLTKLFSDQAELLIFLQQALQNARDAQSTMSTRLSELSSRITSSMADRMILKANQNFSQNVAGSVLTGVISTSTMGGAGKNSHNSRLETKAHNKNMGENRSAMREQQDAIKQMERDGLQNTPEYQAAQDRLAETQGQGQMLQETHELQKTKTDFRNTAYMAAQGYSGTAGGMLSAGAALTDGAGDADIARAQASRDADDEMRKRSDQAIQSIESDVNDAMRALRDIEEASNALIGQVANKI